MFADPTKSVWCGPSRNAVIPARNEPCRATTSRSFQPSYTLSLLYVPPHALIVKRLRDGLDMSAAVGTLLMDRPASTSSRCL